MKYRIVAEPRLGDSDSYKVQYKGCGPFSFFWHNHKRCSPYGPYTYTVYFKTLKQAEKAMEDLRRYDGSRNQIVREVGCEGEDIL